LEEHSILQIVTHNRVLDTGSLVFIVFGHLLAWLVHGEQIANDILQGCNLSDGRFRFHPKQLDIHMQNSSITLLYSTLLYITLHYSTLLYVTLRYSTLLYVTLRYSTLLYVTLCYSMLL
jgi:hypothetical protein